MIVSRFFLEVTNLYIFESDLQLDVKGCRDIYASFDKYVEVERLEGDNRYHAEQHGLQVGYLCIYDLYIFWYFILFVKLDDNDGRESLESASMFDLLASLGHYLLRPFIVLKYLTF